MVKIPANLRLIVLKRSSFIQKITNLFIAPIDSSFIFSNLNRQNAFHVLQKHPFSEKREKDKAESGTEDKKEAPNLTLLKEKIF